MNSLIQGPRIYKIWVATYRRGQTKGQEESQKSDHRILLVRLVPSSFSKGLQQEVC